MYIKCSSERKSSTSTNYESRIELVTSCHLRTLYKSTPPSSPSLLPTMASRNCKSPLPFLLLLLLIASPPLQARKLLHFDHKSTTLLRSDNDDDGLRVSLLQTIIRSPLPFRGLKHTERTLGSVPSPGIGH